MYTHAFIHEIFSDLPFQRTIASTHGRTKVKQPSQISAAASVDSQSSLATKPLLACHTLHGTSLLPPGFTLSARHLCLFLLDSLLKDLWHNGTTHNLVLVYLGVYALESNTQTHRGVWTKHKLHTLSAWW